MKSLLRRITWTVISGCILLACQTKVQSRAPEKQNTRAQLDSLKLVIWLTEEAVKKPSRVKADYYWALHTALTKYGIEIPFPQRDLNFRNMGEFTLRKPEPDSGD